MYVAHFDIDGHHTQRWPLSTPGGGEWPMQASHDAWTEHGSSTDEAAMRREVLGTARVSFGPAIYVAAETCDAMLRRLEQSLRLQFHTK